MIESGKKHGVRKETVLKGLSLSAGVAVARVCRFNETRHNNLEIYKVNGEGIDHEIARAKRALDIASERVELLRQETEKKIGKAEAEIFTAQKMIIEDPALLQGIEDILKKESTNAEAAVMVVLDSYEARIRQIDNEYMQDRAGDFVEIKNRLLDVLRNIDPVFQCVDEAHCQRGCNRIVVTGELTPGMTLELDTEHTLGFVTERGGANSHASILARALGIPAVSGIANGNSPILCGTEVAIDGDEGEVILWPTEETIARLNGRIGLPVPAADVADPVAGLTVMANINGASDLQEALDVKAEGIGLYRTEFEFMAEGRFLNEEEQYARYTRAVKALSGRPVTFRMFDAGSDKPLPFIVALQEDNPALGLRGGRLLLRESELFRTQARAIVRASAFGPVRVLYPMVVDLEQYLEMRKVFDDSVQDLGSNAVAHGVMFEVPSACLDARRLMKACDFASIGTNDLIQYLFAVDRNNVNVAYDYSPDRKILWKVIGDIASAASKEGKTVSVCGELAGDPKYIEKLMRKGIYDVSVSSRLISGVRQGAANVVSNNK